MNVREWHCKFEYEGGAAPLLKQALHLENEPLWFHKVTTGEAILSCKIERERIETSAPVSTTTGTQTPSMIIGTLGLSVYCLLEAK